MSYDYEQVEKGYDEHEASSQASAVLTLRDYFAAKAMAMMYESGYHPVVTDVARRAYAYADAMLKERAK